jgi:hypothetical protein
VEQTGADRAGIEAQLADQLGDAERVDDVGLAGATKLTCVGLLGECVRPTDEIEIRTRLIARYLVQ